MVILPLRVGSWINLTIKTAILLLEIVIKKCNLPTKMDLNYKTYSLSIIFVEEIYLEAQQKT